MVGSFACWVYVGVGCLVVGGWRSEQYVRDNVLHGFDRDFIVRLTEHT